MTSSTSSRPTEMRTRAVADAELGPLLGANAHVRRGRRVGHHALGVAQVVGDVDQLQAVQRLEAGGLAALDVEGHDAAEVGHLLGGELVLRMVGATRIEHAADPGIRGQRVGDLARVGAMAIDSQAERLEALHEHPGIERADRGAGVAGDRLQLVDDERPAAQHRAAQRAALAVDVLGRRMHDDVGPELERPLQDRRREGVVEHDRGAGLVREVAHCFHIDDVEHRVRGRFEQHRLRRLAERLLPLRKITAIDELAGDAVLRQQLVDDVSGTSRRAGVPRRCDRRTSAA